MKVKELFDRIFMSREGYIRKYVITPDDKRSELILKDLSNLRYSLVAGRASEYYFAALHIKTIIDRYK